MCIRDSPDDILSFNLLFFVPVTPGLLTDTVNNAFSDLPPNMYGGAFPTGEDTLQLDLTFEDHETEYVVQTHVGNGNAGFPTPTTAPPWDPCLPTVGIPPIGDGPLPQCP